MDFPGSTLTVALILLGCGGAHPARPATIAEETEDRRPRVGPPELLWSAGEDRITVRGIGVAIQVTAPIVRLAIDEVASDACGDRLVHVMVVDRRHSPEIDTILARALLRAGCPIPDEGRITRSTGDGSERAMTVHFEEGAMQGDWALRAVVLDRAHRSVAVVSALRVDARGAPERLFEIVDDAPGLEGVDIPGGEPAQESEQPPDRARPFEVAFGVFRAVGEVLRFFSR